MPDVPARPVDDLVRGAAHALAHADDVHFEIAGKGLGELITELHVLAATGAADTRRTTLAALVEACIVVRALAGTLGHAELAAHAARRGYDAARRLGRIDLVGLMAMGRTMTLGRLGARRRAHTIAETVLAEVAAEPGPTPGHTTVAEARGMLHLSSRAGISPRWPDRRGPDPPCGGAVTGSSHRRAQPPPVSLRSFQRGSLGSDDRGRERSWTRSR